MWLLLILGYLLGLAAVLVFFAGSSIVNQRWEEDNDRMLRLHLFRDAA